MKHIRNIFKRIFISIFGGSMITELIVMSAGNEYRENISPIFFMFLTFVVLSAIVLYDKYKYYYFPDKEDKKENNILDDEIK